MAKDKSHNKNIIKSKKNDGEKAISNDVLEKINSHNRTELLGLLNEFILQTYKIEKEFKDYKALYEWVIEILPQAIWVINDNGSFFYKNTLANELQAIFKEAQKQNFDGEIEYEQKTYLFQSNSIQNKQVVTATDISVQKRQERLASMGRVSAHLAHEIRNPIGSISLLTSTLIKRVDNSSRPIILEIQKALWRVERIISATLLFSKGVNIHKTLHKLSELQDDIQEAIEQYTYSKEIKFLFDFEDKEASFDLSLMGIVLQNFIYNAIDAIEDEDISNGIVGLDAKIIDGQIIFNITDNGKAVENKKLLFEPFETTKLKGNGLGLALSLQIVEAHGGNIELLENKNKVFQIRFPNS